MKSTLVKLALLAALVTAIYYPGKGGPFLADDYSSIIKNNGIRIEQLNRQELASAWDANSSGPLGRPIASLSFALNYYFAGQQFEHAAFKLTNIGIHVLNACLVFFIGRLLFAAVSPNFSAQKPAFIASLIWAVHPLQLTSVLYVVQRMTSLACLFMLGGFLLFLHGRLHPDKRGSLLLIYAGCLGGTLLGGLTKEIALLLPFLILSTELTVLRQVDPGKLRKPLYGFYGITVLIPILLAVAYLISHPDFISGSYASRDFTLEERVLTQARVLFYYLGLLFYPNNSALGLYHDDFIISHSLLNPVSTFFAIIGIVALLAFAVISSVRNKAPFLSFAIAWFFISQSMESTVIGLEMIYEHRNYLASVGFIIGIIGFTYPWLAKLESKLLPVLLFTCLIASLAFLTYVRASIWSSRDSFAYFEMRNHPLSVRAQSSYAKNIELNNGPDSEAYEHYRLAAQLDTHEISSLAYMFQALNRILSSSAFAGSSPGTTSLAVHYDDPLMPNQDYARSLLVLVNQEIIDRIRHKTNPLRTTVSLQLATECLLNGAPQCANNAPYILDWINAVMTRRDFFDVAFIQTIRAKIYFHQGDLNHALESISLAINAAPQVFYYYAEKATLYILLNQYEAAESVLNEAKAKIKMAGFDQREYNRVKQNLENRKAEASGLNVMQ